MKPGGQSHRHRVLLIEDDPKDAEIFAFLLGKEDYDVEIAINGRDGLKLAEDGSFDVVLTDLNLGGAQWDEGRRVVKELRESRPDLPVILMTGLHTADIAIDVIQLGAFDYFSKPIDVDDPAFRLELSTMLEQAAASKRPAAPGETAGESDPEAKQAGDRIIGNTRVMQNVYKEIGRLAEKPVTVFIRGETGTGKELVARALYTHGHRADQAFIVVNCTAIPENLLESELFGHEPGAFTGATARRIGRFEQADRGTIFLDEIGDMDLKIQQKLLRVLQEQTFERVGGKETIRVDVRIIAATHRNLEEAIEKNEFRQDLYFRLNVAVISLPPLRERKEDIPLLVDYFIERYGAELGSPTSKVDDEAIQRLQEQPWLGNVRELRGVVRKALLLSHGYKITANIVRRALEQTKPSRAASHGPFAAQVAATLASAQAGERENVIEDLTDLVERELYTQAFRRAKRDQSKAAKWLGVSRPTMREKLLRYGLHSKSDKAKE